MAADSTNRTLVLSVVAVDLVGYSRKSVAEQMSLKESFNHALLEAIRDIAVADRIILDTGDGVAMGFLGDPEDALYVAMFMHEAINRDSSGSPSGSMDSNAIRIGINLGPVKLATGAGGHPNIVGDGINVAERIMGFAEPGQLTASHAVYEIMSRMSDHYATLFQYLGVHTDKQVRSHDVYLVGRSAAAFRQAQRGVAERAAARDGRPPPAHEPVLAATSTSAQPQAGNVIGANSRTAKVTADTHRAAAPAATNTASESPANVYSHAAASDPYPNRHRALIDFLEDRNKVATTATALAITAVVLAALLAYRKMPLSPPASGIQGVAAEATAPPPVSAPLPVPAPKTPGETPLPSDPAKTQAVAPVAAKTSEAAMQTAAKPAPSVPPPANSAPTVPVPRPAGDTRSAAVAVAPGANAAKPVATPSPATAAIGAAKLPERNSPSAASEAGAATAALEKAKELRNDKAGKAERAEKIEKAERPLKSDRNASRNPAGSAAPIVPAFQSPAEAPRTESAAPTPAPAPPPAPAIDTRVIRLSRTDPAFPIEAVRQGVSSGYVRARITIDANGNVSDVAILESRPISAFGRETRQAVQLWKYNPGAAGRTQEIELSFKP